MEPAAPAVLMAAKADRTVRAGPAGKDPGYAALF